MGLSAKDTYRSDSDALPQVLATPVGRRAMLAWGARGAPTCFWASEGAPEFNWWKGAAGCRSACPWLIEA